MTWKFPAFVFPPRGRKPRIVPMSEHDRRTNEELHRRREAARLQRETREAQTS